MADRGEITVLMITHKFREVEAFAEDVSVLRKGKLAGQGKVADLTRDDMAAMMIGSREVAQVATREGAADTRHAGAADRRRSKAKDQTGTQDDRRSTSSSSTRREIVGIAGVSGNGQKELAEVLGRPASGGGGRDHGRRHALRRHAAPRRAKHQVRFIPEEPLQERLRAAHGGGRKPRVPHLRRERRRQAGSFWLKLKAMRANARDADRALQREDRLDRRRRSRRSPAATCSAPCWPAS